MDETLHMEIPIIPICKRENSRSQSDFTECVTRNTLIKQPKCHEIEREERMPKDRM